MAAVPGSTKLTLGLQQCLASLRHGERKNAPGAEKPSGAGKNEMSGRDYFATSPSHS